VPFIAQPPQSRDATVASRYFPTTPVSHGRVLVPSSSPLNPDSTYRSYPSYGHFQSHDVAALQGFIHSNGWGGSFGSDPLSAPSGFTSYNGTPHAPLSRQWTDQGKRMSVGENIGGDGPPRKRMRGESQQAPNVMNSPGSPDVRLPGQRSRMSHNGAAGLSGSSEDLTPEIRDLFDSPSQPHIVRGRPDSHGSTTPVTGQTDTEDPKLTRFALTMPQHRKEVVRHAWQQTNGDARKASDLLQDPVWLRNPSGSAQPSPETIGRVKEVIEATKAQRAAAKEMGKNSLIYANRPAPNISTPLASKTAISVISSPVTPLSPDVLRPRAKRTKKVVIDSDSDTEAEDFRHISKRQKVTSDESRALDYLNNAGSDGLQELTGRFSCVPFISVSLKFVVRVHTSTG
jgi:SWI/SNF-related matrix-associated actin-dependent regulator 1 of chromatin subfamily A